MAPTHSSAAVAEEGTERTPYYHRHTSLFNISCKTLNWIEDNSGFERGGREAESDGLRLGEDMGGFLNHGSVETDKYGATPISRVISTV